jgi:hypothetical protein
MEENKPFTANDSLAVIQQMINTARREQQDSGKGWIIWGWLLFTASISSFINMYTGTFSQYFFWNLFGLLTLAMLVYSVAIALLGKSKERIKTYTGELYRRLNIGFFITLMLIIVSINTGVTPTKGFALLMALYGFWALIYGATSNFRPSIYGSYFTWACALAAMFVHDFRWTMLLHGIAVLGGYIIPGHTANYQYRKTRKTNV